MAALFTLNDRIIFIATTVPVHNSLPSRTTDYHVESGSNISVNIINDPETVSFTGYVSEIFYRQQVNADFGADPISPDEVKVLMKDFRKQRKTFQAVVNDITFTNAVFEDINFVNDVSVGNSLKFHTTIKDIKLVSQNPSQRIPSNTNNQNNKDNNTPNNNTGTKIPTPDSDLPSSINNIINGFSL